MNKKEWIFVNDSLPKKGTVVFGLLINYYTKDKIEKRIIRDEEEWLIDNNETLPFDYDVLAWSH